MREPRSVLITGASSGIGAALAEAYAAPGVELALNGRNEERLGAVARSCTARGAVTVTAAMDVTDATALGAWIRDGVVNTVHPAIDAMLARPRVPGRARGQIALMSSIASFRGFAGAPAYCASKAAVRSYGEGLRNAHAADGTTGPRGLGSPAAGS